MVTAATDAYRHAPRAGKSATTTFPCGCQLRRPARSSGVAATFTYCPMHRAAPEMRDALRKTAAVCAGETMNKQGLIDALEAAQAALKLAGDLS